VTIPYRNAQAPTLGTYSSITSRNEVREAQRLEVARNTDRMDANTASVRAFHLEKFSGKGQKTPCAIRDIYYPEDLFIFKGRFHIYYNFYYSLPSESRIDDSVAHECPDL